MFTSTTALPLLLILLVIYSLQSNATTPTAFLSQQPHCHNHNERSSSSSPTTSQTSDYGRLKRRSPTDFLFYALTQDCQLVFGSLDQLHRLRSSVEVDTRLNYCLPGLLQLHWRQWDITNSNAPSGLQLMIKKGDRQVCTLPLEVPESTSIVGPDLFAYSIRSSLHYAACSHLSNSSFTIEPELSFMDGNHSDVVHFVDPKATGRHWTIRQFRIDGSGYLRPFGGDSAKVAAINTEGGQPEEKAGDYLLALDAQRQRLYAVHRKRKVAVDVCSVKEWLMDGSGSGGSMESIHLHGHGVPIAGRRINSFSADHARLIFSEMERTGSDSYSTRIYLALANTNHSAECILELPYLVKLGFISRASLAKLQQGRLPGVAENGGSGGGKATSINQRQPTTTTRPRTTTHHHVKPTTATSRRTTTTNNPIAPGSLLPVTLSGGDGEDDGSHSGEEDDQWALDSQSAAEESTAIDGISGYSAAPVVGGSVKAAGEEEDVGTFKSARVNGENGGVRTSGVGMGIISGALLIINLW